MPEGKIVDGRWMQWLVRNKLRGINDTELIRIMKRRGFERDGISEAIKIIDKSDIFVAANSVARRVRNLETLLDVRLALNSQSYEIERREGVGREEFHERYYSLNRPVVLTDLMTDWPALKLWSPSYLASLIGDLIVEIQASRRSEPVYEVFLKGHTKQVRMREFINMLLEGGETNEFYLTANDRLLERAGAEILLQDFSPPQTMLTPKAEAGMQFFWFGPKGAVSPLHRDKLNVLMTQVYGRKRVKMIPSDALHLVYNFESFFSEVDCENPDLERFPLFANAPIIDVDLMPGDSLFIPVGWWHHVRALEISINVSFTNFAFDNDFGSLYRKT